MRKVAWCAISSLVLMVFIPYGSADHTQGDSDSTDCPLSLCRTTAHVTGVLPDNQECEHPCYCQSTGCYFSISCGGSVQAVIVVSGSLKCGTVNNEGVIGSEIGTASCKDGPKLDDVSCSMGVGDRYWVPIGTCRLAGVEVAGGGAGGGVAVAAINPCVTAAGDPYFGQNPL